MTPKLVKRAESDTVRRARQEVERLERMLHNRKARVADAEHKLAAAKERLEAAR